MKYVFSQFNKLLNNKLAIMINTLFILILIGIIISVSITNAKLLESIEQLKHENDIQIKKYEELLNEYEVLESKFEEYKLQYNDDTLIKNIDVYQMNPHSKSNLSVEQLDEMLRDTGLESHGVAFKNMEDTYNVNALFAIGVAMHESANGFKTANTYNYFGFKGNNGWMSFSSPNECILYFGKLISQNYSHCFTLSSIQYKYCPNNSSWTQRVITHMNQLKLKIDL